MSYDGCYGNLLATSKYLNQCGQDEHLHKIKYQRAYDERIEERNGHIHRIYRLVHGKLSGSEVVWNNDHSISRVTQWVDGQREGLETYYPNESIRIEVNWHHNCRHGPSRIWQGTTLLVENNWRRGLHHGSEGFLGEDDNWYDIQWRGGMILPGEMMTFIRQIQGQMLNHSLNYVRYIAFFSLSKPHIDPIIEIMTQ